jgi:ribonuclease/clavin/mitogillin
MLRATPHGDVLEIRLGRSVLGWAPFTVRAFLAGGILIDAGPPATGRALARFLRGRLPAVVVNTHSHEDHAGGDRRLAALGVPALAHREALPALARPPGASALRRLVCGRPRPVEAAPLPARVEAGGTTLEAIETPGHAPDHIAFFDRERRALFTGDLFLGERVRVFRRDEDVHKTLESLRRAAALEPIRLFCSHLGLVEDGAGALRRKIAFLEDLVAKIGELHGKGTLPREIRKRLLGREPPLAYLSCGEFSKLNLVLSLIGRLP